MTWAEGRENAWNSTKNSIYHAATGKYLPAEGARPGQQAIGALPPGGSERQRVARTQFNTPNAHHRVAHSHPLHRLREKIQAATPAEQPENAQQPENGQVEFLN